LGLPKLFWNKTQNAFVLFALKALPGAIGEIKTVLLVIFQEWELERHDS
jgi:hypothetical protein